MELYNKWVFVNSCGRKFYMGFSTTTIDYVYLNFI